MKLPLLPAMPRPRPCTHSRALVPARGGHGRRPAAWAPPSPAALVLLASGLCSHTPEGVSQLSVSGSVQGWPAASRASGHCSWKPRGEAPGGRQQVGMLEHALPGSPRGYSHALQTGWPATCADLVLNPRPALLRSKCSGLEVSAGSWSH